MTLFAHVERLTKMATFDEMCQSLDMGHHEDVYCILEQLVATRSKR